MLITWIIYLISLFYAICGFIEILFVYQNRRDVSFIILTVTAFLGSLGGLIFY